MYAVKCPYLESLHKSLLCQVLTKLGPKAKNSEAVAYSKWAKSNFCFLRAEERMNLKNFSWS